MRPKEAVLMTQCIEDGVRIGLMQAFEHSDRPDEERIVEVIAREVMNKIDEYWAFEEARPNEEAEWYAELNRGYAQDRM